MALMNLDDLRTLYESEQICSDYLDYDPDLGRGLVDYYQPASEETLVHIVNQVTTLVWIALDVESEAVPRDIEHAIVGVAKCLDKHGIKWTSGRG